MLRARSVSPLSLIGVHHFAAPGGTEYLADRGFVGLACTVYANGGPSRKQRGLFGTNPISFVGRDLVAARLFMIWQLPQWRWAMYRLRHVMGAKCRLALDLIRIAAIALTRLPLPSVLLPFGGYKGSAIALMVELSRQPSGEQFSYEARETDNNDGGPPRGGEMIIGMSPDIIAGPNWEDHVEAFMQKITSIQGVRLPGARRHKNREDTGPRQVNEALLNTITDLL